MASSLGRGDSSTNSGTVIDHVSRQNLDFTNFLFSLSRQFANSLFHNFLQHSLSVMNGHRVTGRTVTQEKYRCEGSWSINVETLKRVACCSRKENVKPLILSWCTWSSPCKDILRDYMLCRGNYFFDIWYMGSLFIRYIFRFPLFDMWFCGVFFPVRSLFLCVFNFWPSRVMQCMLTVVSVVTCHCTSR